MSDSIIQVRDLGKSFNISHEVEKESYKALRDVIANRAKKIFSFPQNFRNESGFKKANIEEFWALKDVSFDIKQGDRVGIIGRNGSGKSTLLKILSRITEPTTGEIRIKGRVASLLEIGTGFHPELTGRENIFLNGAILGMSRAQIKRNFEEIVNFADVEFFLDTPIKRYSSGMYVRLAFAVAAHLESEILIVDEVLAVGDAQFQKKCLDKMEDISNKNGRTILFVSHSMSAIQKFCTTGILLNNGVILDKGNLNKTILSYLESNKISDNTYISKRKIKGPITINSVSICNLNGIEKNLFGHDEDMLVKLSFIIDDVNKKLNYKILVIVQDQFKRKIFSAECDIKAYKIDLMIEKFFLVRGNYSLQCIIYVPGIKQYENIEECCFFEILDKGSPFSHLENFDYGIIFGKFKWIEV
jgi:lipopolysaccharide transport system ATP-binding protein